jgi:alkylation response protein AidB-like acyl-CoA dehydrogenase
MPHTVSCHCGRLRLEVLYDTRILSIFEGAAEIQAQVIARRLLEAWG